LGGGQEVRTGRMLVIRVRNKIVLNKKYSRKCIFCYLEHWKLGKPVWYDFWWWEACMGFEFRS
jgi:hypothetical protein